MRTAICVVAVVLLLMVRSAAAQNCAAGLSCDQVPWRLPIYPQLQSPTPFPTQYVTLTPDAPTATNTPFYCPTATPSYSSKVLGYAPAAYWQLAETAGGVAFDATGGEDGTYANGTSLNATTFVNGQPAPFFDGTNDRVNVPISSIFNWSSGTVMVWFKAPDSAFWSDGLRHYFFQYQAGDTDSWLFLDKFDDGRLHWFRGASNLTLFHTFSATTAWTQMVYTWGADLRAYVNGSEVASTTVTASTPGATILRSFIGDTANAYLAHVALWTSALSAGAIADLASVPVTSPTPTGCAAPPTATPTSFSGVAVDLEGQIETLSAIMTGTPINIVVSGTPFDSSAAFTELGENAGSFFGYARGLSTGSYLGPFTPLVALSTLALLVVASVMLLTFFGPVFGVIFGFIRKIISLILDFLPL